MLLSTININGCGGWQKIRLISNAIGSSNFGTIPAAGTRLSCSNMLVLKCCACIHQIPSSHLQLRYFNQTAAISSTTKSLTKAAAAAGNEQQPKPSKSIETNENQQQAKCSPETTEEEQQKQQNETDEPQHFQLAKASIAIGPNRNIEIECCQDAHGHRIIQINRLPNIPVPQDAYKIVTAFDRLIGQLPVEEPKHPEDIVPQRVLAFQMLEVSLHNYFNLLIVWRQEIGQWHLHIHSVKTWEKLLKEKEAHFPLWTLPKLRQQMATMLEEHDGSEQIDEMPTMPEWATQEGQQESNGESEQTKEKIKADQALPVLLAKTSIIVGQNNRKLLIECRQGKSGQKFIHISMAIPKESTRIYGDLPKIRVPQDAYKFLGATDLLIGQLPVDAPANRPARRPILARQMGVEDDHDQRYGFRLSVVWHQKDGQWHCYIRSVQTVQEHKPREVDFPLWALPQLRQQMATMLTENDGSMRIDDMPTVPEWAIQADESNLETSDAVQSRPLDLTPKKSISIGTGRTLYIQCQQWESGQKFLNISKYKAMTPAPHYLPNILVPENAYKFVDSIDEVIRKLPVEEPTHPEGDILATEKVAGDSHYDFKLSAWYKKGGQWHFAIRSVPTLTGEHKERLLYFPFSALPWFRQQMVEMLEEHDGTQQINEMPTIPEWAKQEKAEKDDTESKEGNEPSESGSNENDGPPQQIETEMEQPKVLELAKSRLPLGPNRKLYIKCGQGRRGQKTIEIYIHLEQKLESPRFIHIRVPKIHVSEEAYKFVVALDRLIGQLPVKAPANPPPAADGSLPTLANQLVEDGIFYDFQLSVLWFERGRHWQLKIRSVKTVQEHNEKGVQIPLWTLPLLRQKMATFLEKLDGTQRIDKMPTMPKWATQFSN